MTPQMQALLEPIFPSVDPEFCKQNVSNARIFVVLGKKAGSSEDLQTKLLEKFSDKLDHGSLEKDTELSEDEKTETLRYAKYLLKFLIQKLWDTEDLSVDEICQWVSGIYSDEEKLPYFYAKNPDTGIEMVVTKISDEPNVGNVADDFDPHTEL